MRKGFSWIISLLMAIILLIGAAALFWRNMIPTSSDYVDDTETDTVQCKTSNDCTDSPYGSKCMLVYQSDYKAFCGCAMNEDCQGRGGESCGFDNKCA
jgi:hypothetical protein